MPHDDRVAIDRLLEKMLQLVRLAADESASKNEASNATVAAAKVHHKLVSEYKLTDKEIRDYINSHMGVADEEEESDDEDHAPSTPPPVEEEDPLPPPKRAKRARVEREDGYDMDEVKMVRPWLEDYCRMAAEHSGCAFVLHKGKHYFFGREEAREEALRKVAFAISTSEQAIKMRGKGYMERLMGEILPHANMVGGIGMAMGASPMNGLRDVWDKARTAILGLYERAFMDGYLLAIETKDPDDELLKAKRKAKAANEEWVMRTGMLDKSMVLAQRSPTSSRMFSNNSRRSYWSSTKSFQTRPASRGSTRTM